MKADTLTPELLHKMNAYWRAADYLSVGQNFIYVHLSRVIKQFDLDRLHLVQDVVNRMPHLGTKGDYLKQLIQDKLIEHQHYVDQHGQDRPEIRNWKWSRPEERVPFPRRATPAPKQGYSS
jgi:phosphoketolase